MGLRPAVATTEPDRQDGPGKLADRRPAGTGCWARWDSSGDPRRSEAVGIGWCVAGQAPAVHRLLRDSPASALRRTRLRDRAQRKPCTRWSTRLAASNHTLCAAHAAGACAISCVVHGVVFGHRSVNSTGRLARWHRARQLNIVTVAQTDGAGTRDRREPGTGGDREGFGVGTGPPYPPLPPTTTLSPSPWHWQDLVVSVGRQCQVPMSSSDVKFRCQVPMSSSEASESL